MNPVPIVTLGPVGSCSEAVTRDYSERLGLGQRVDLRGSYELGLEAVEKSEADALVVAAAYPQLNELVMRVPIITAIVDSFVQATPPLVIVTSPSPTSVVNLDAEFSIACTQAAMPLVKHRCRLASIVLASSNSEAPFHIMRGETEAALTTRLAAEMHGLVEIYSFGAVPMAWVVFRRL